MKSCCFIGHRKIPNDVNIENNVIEIVKKLIVEENVRIFNFGSRSDFDTLCHSIVTDLKEEYKDIQRRAYTCRSESCTLEKERAYWEEIYSHFSKRPVTLLGIEEEVEHKTKWDSGRAQYVERNYAMIDDSDFCVFYYNEEYKPPLRKQCRSALSTYQPKSGTKLAYDYAFKKKKKIVNIYRLIY